MTHQINDTSELSELGPGPHWLPHRIKPGVKLAGITPQMAIAYTIACAIYDAHGVTCVLTSALDGRHSRKSLHYSGNAIDLRTRHLPNQLLSAITVALDVALGEEFDVVLEETHLHVEYQPKGEG